MKSYLLFFISTVCFAEGRGNGGGINSFWGILLVFLLFIAYKFREHLFVLSWSFVLIVMPIGMGIYLLNENNTFGLLFIGFGAYIYYKLFCKKN
jgi:hypothetical protein